MVTRCLHIFGVTRTFIRPVRHICSKHIVCAIHKSESKRTVVKSLRKDDDPDVFGTLSSRRSVRLSQKLESLANKDKALDIGDAKEEEFLSFEPLSKKKVEEYVEEIKALIDKKRLKDALYLLEVTMKEDKVRPSRGIYSMLIGACGKAGYTKKAFSLFNNMKKRGFDPADSHFTALFNACANSPWPADGLQRAIKLRQQLADKNLLLNRQQYHAMIKAFGHCGDISTALQVMEEMASNHLPITTETFNFLLHGCISLRTDGFSHALLVWRQLRNKRVTPEIYSYNLMLRCTRDCGVEMKTSEKLQPQESVLLLEERDRKNNGISTTTNSLELSTTEHIITPKPFSLLADRVNQMNIVSFRGLENPENRLELLGGIDGFLEEMEKDHVRPDIKTFTLMLETIASNRKEENKLIERMKNAKVEPDVSFFNILIKKRQFRQDYSGAKEILNYLQEYKLTPDIMTFGVLAMGCRSIEETNQLLDNMETAGFRVNIEIFGCLLKNAIVQKKCYFLVDLMNRAEKMNVTLNEKAIKLLDTFKRETTEAMAKYDRGIEVPKVYGDKSFRKAFKIFCYEFKPKLQNLKVELEQHPWQQYRYPKAEDQTEQTHSTLSMNTLTS